MMPKKKQKGLMLNTEGFLENWLCSGCANKTMGYHLKEGSEDTYEMRCSTCSKGQAPKTKRKGKK